MTPELLGRLFKINLYTLTVNTEGITDEESRRPPGPGINSLNWVVGHLLDTRNAIMALLGAPPVFADPRSEHYKRGGTGELAAGGAIPLPDLMAAMETAQAALVGRLRELSPTELAVPCTLPGFEKLPGETVGEKVAFLHFHESYHCGQVGLLRRLLGKPGAIR